MWNDCFAAGFPAGVAAGAAAALPMLESMQAVAAASRESRAVRRVAVVYVPNGIIMNDWLPTGTGRDFAFPRILKPLTLQETKDHRLTRWQVEKQPVYLANGDKVPDCFAIVRGDTNDVLGTVGARYQIVQNAELAQYLAKVEPVGEICLKAVDQFA